MSFKATYVEEVHWCDFCGEADRPGFAQEQDGKCSIEICLECINAARDLIPTHETPEPDNCLCDACGRPEASPSIISKRNLCDVCAEKEAIDQ
jgi:hypothetical protein